MDSDIHRLDFYDFLSMPMTRSSEIELNAGDSEKAHPTCDFDSRVEQKGRRKGHEKRNRCSGKGKGPFRWISQKLEERCDVRLPAVGHNRHVSFRI